MKINFCRDFYSRKRKKTKIGQNSCRFEFSWRVCSSSSLRTWAKYSLPPKSRCDRVPSGTSSSRIELEMRAARWIFLFCFSLRKDEFSFSCFRNEVRLAFVAAKFRLFEFSTENKLEESKFVDKFLVNEFDLKRTLFACSRCASSSKSTRLERWFDVSTVGIAGRTVKPFRCDDREAGTRKSSENKIFLRCSAERKYFLWINLCFEWNESNCWIRQSNKSFCFCSSAVGKRIRRAADLRPDLSRDPSRTDKHTICS